MLTERKRLYSEARERGENILASAIYAGCPKKTAQQAGSRYEKDPDVIACRERIRTGAPEPEPERIPTAADTIPHKMIKSAKKIEQSSARNAARNYEDPKEFLLDVMNDGLEDPRLRVDAAKTLLPYLHVKKDSAAKKPTPGALEPGKISKFRPRAV